MVNVSGRSKGCSTCRRRRVKCDLNRPICLRCQRGGLECDGPRDMAFVEATIVQSRRKFELPSATPPAESSLSGTGASTDSHSLPDARTLTDSQLIRLSVPLFENPQELYIIFTRKFIAVGRPVELALRELQSRDITRLETDNTAQCRTAHLRAALSFATVFFGTKHKRADIIQQGYLSHGATLKQLNRALSKPNCYEYDEVIVSVTILAIQEVLVPSGPKHFLNHMVGLEKLLTLRDPRSNCLPRTVGLYKCLRHMLLRAALSAGRASVIAKPEWKAILAQNCENEAELQEQQLYEVLADCSVLIAEREELMRDWEANLEDRAKQAESVRQRADALLDMLRGWRRQWDTNPRNAYVEVPAYSASTQPGEQSRHDDTNTTTTDFVFPSISSALLLTLYNTAILYVLQNLLSLPFESRHLPRTNEYAAAAHSAVMEICQSIPYSSDEESHKELHAAPVIHWAVQVAGMVLKDDVSTEGKYLVDVLKCKSARLVFGV